MSIASFFQEYGLSVNFSDPLWFTTRVQLGNFANHIDGYDHEHNADGGFGSANITLAANRNDVDEWIEYGLGRHIEVDGPHLGRVWEGFVNRVDVDIGPLSITRGPLLNIGNRVDIVYSTIDTTSEPPAIGQRERLSDWIGYTNDTASQALYGIIEKILSTGGLTGQADAAKIVDTYIAENRLPETSQTFSTTRNAGGATIRLSCLGYRSWLEAYVYNLTTGGDVNLSAKLTAVLAADPNGIISTNYFNVTANTYQVSQWEDEDRTAWSIIKSLLAYGDASDVRYMFGIYEDRIPYYTAMTNDIAYYQELSDLAMRVKTTSGATIYPWDVRPARWLFYPDFLTGRSEPLTLADQRDDPRFEFIETVRYTAPQGLSHNGAKQGTLKQVLAKYGVTGVGA